MKKALPLITLICLLSLFSCKRACYQCIQQCTYCTLNTDSSVIHKICASRDGASGLIKAASDSLIANGYRCNAPLTDQQTVCDGKNSIDEAISYFRRQDYYCYPKE